MAQVVLITGARAPVALHMARLLHEAGLEVHLADCVGTPLAAASRMHAGFHRVPSFRDDLAGAGQALSALIRRLGVELVIPTCEEVLYLARIWSGQTMPVPLFSPGFQLLEEVHDKFRFIQLCQRLGLAVPRTWRLDTAADLAAVAGQAEEMVFKPVWSRFATQTLIRPALGQLAKIGPSPEVPWVAQEFVAGDEICVYAVAQAGRLVALSAYRGLVRAGVGASIAFAPVAEPGVTRFVRDFVAGTGWTGQISFDLIRRADGAILPLECNPRATSGLHFFRAGAAFAKAVLEDAEVQPDVTRPQSVRLALWLYGLPLALRPGGWARVRDALQNAEDVMDWPGDALTLRDQLRPVAGFARLALRHRLSLEAASTRDIEWNGRDQSSIS